MSVKLHIIKMLRNVSYSESGPEEGSLSDVFGRWCREYLYDEVAESEDWIETDHRDPHE